MQILGVTAAAADPSQTAATGSAATTPTSTSPTDKLATESTFLQLLVAQIKNQDPLNPTDSMQFVGQLVQFSQLEQLIGIKSDVDKLGVTPPTTPTPTTVADIAAATAKSI
jgi:flagellar basal-body rod modification protein FlgD